MNHGFIQMEYLRRRMNTTGHCLRTLWSPFKSCWLPSKLWFRVMFQLKALLVVPFFITMVLMWLLNQHSTHISGNVWLGLLNNSNLARNCPDQTWCRMERLPSPHTTISTRRMIQDIFGDRVVGKHFPISWPPYSPDLTPADFWLWLTLKRMIFKSRNQP